MSIFSFFSSKAIIGLSIALVLSAGANGLMYNKLKNKDKTITFKQAVIDKIAIKAARYRRLAEGEQSARKADADFNSASLGDYYNVCQANLAKALELSRLSRINPTPKVNNENSNGFTCDCPSFSVRSLQTEPRATTPN